ncbi:glycosyltransferase family 4 protein [Sutcliffiella horikoshii]|uniref:Glycosyltransferase family 4 protein n=1 Tax=Sutcliffiella horikoshii TaxID=79883 RepID=A0A5D4T4K6_9BACI|nr:glycosyltransferase family 4 protein [Sutcliffiella horikoshii]TYS69841.1 glycosyltransferase family 4 protein [Sutcliffiella horikoshii]
MNKRVLMISQNFYPEIGSAANRMKNIYKLLKENGFDVEVITTEPAYPNKKIYKDEKFWDDDSINEDEKSRIKRTSVKTRKYSRTILNRLFYYLEISLKMLIYIFRSKKKYDVVYVTSPAIFIGIVGVIAKYRFKSKLLLDIRDLWPESLKGVGVLDNNTVINLFSRIEKILYKNANRIIVNSKGFVNHIINIAGIDSSLVEYIPNGAIKEELITSEAKKGFNVIYAGNIGLAQDTNMIMKLAKELNNRNIDLHIIGYGMKAYELNQFVIENKLSNVFFVSPSTRNECLNIIAKYQVGIVTLNDKQVFETVLPGKIIDYMTIGLPIVASVSGYSKKIIEDTKSGFVISEKNVDKMIKKIEILYNNSELRTRMSLNGIEAVKANFMWEKNIKTLIKVLEEELNYTHNFNNKNIKQDKVESL